MATLSSTVLISCLVTQLYTQFQIETLTAKLSSYIERRTPDKDRAIVAVGREKKIRISDDEHQRLLDLLVLQMNKQGKSVSIQKYEKAGAKNV